MLRKFLIAFQRGYSHESSWITWPVYGITGPVFRYSRQTVLVPFHNVAHHFYAGFLCPFAPQHPSTIPSASPPRSRPLQNRWDNQSRRSTRALRSRTTIRRANVVICAKQTHRQFGFV